ncbi:MAG: TonB-dependent receptor [Ignavibacteriales bacterium]|nr:MAG: TonB-dependent receptor [Ignavibacteriales bacterium]
MKRFFILFFILGVTCLNFAQDGQSSGDTIKYQMGQITISATRYPENTLEIPYAVSILTREQLNNIKGYGLDEAMMKVPGVLAQSRSGNQDVRLVIRGFGARGSGDRSNSGTSRGLRIMLDGIPETEPDGRTSFDNIDLSLSNYVDVIKSNSSALWGNASGGIINISTIPGLDDEAISFGGMGGSFGFKKFFLRTNATLGVGRLSASASYNIFEGWRNHSGSKRTVINLGLISKLDEATNLGIYLVGTSNIFHIPGPLTDEQFANDPTQANPTYLARDERRYNRLGRIGVTLDHQIDKMHGVSGMAYINPKYLQRSERGTFRDFTRYHTGGNVMYTNTANFNKDINNKFIVGLDEAYQDGAVLFYSLSPTNYRGDELRDNKREGANNFGAFFQNEVRINENLSIILGGRYDNVTYYSESFIETGYGLQTKSFERVTPKAGITYMFSPTHSIYANLGGGVEVPAGNETDPAGTYGQDTVYLLNPLLEPINSTTIEAGTKQLLYLGSSSLLQSVTYDLAGYYIIVKNDIIPYRGGRFYFTAGETNRMGIEAGINLQFDHGISLATSFTYSQNKYKDYMVDSVHYGVAGASADYEDNKVAGVPDYFYYAGLTYEPKGLGGLYLTFNINGLGEYFVDDANKITVPSYNVFGAVLGIKDGIQLTPHISVQGFVSINNLSDEKYIASAFINPDFVNGVPVYLEPGLPRTITASISLGFN